MILLSLLLPTSAGSTTTPTTTTLLLLLLLAQRMGSDGVVQGFFLSGQPQVPPTTSFDVVVGRAAPLSSSSSSLWATRIPNSRRKFSSVRLSAAASSSSSSSSAQPLTPLPNEFSRPLNTDRILKTAAGKQRRSYRNYETTIEASPEECTALANRFEIKSLEQLQADLTLSLPPYYSATQGGGSGGSLIVQVEGNILASLTQTCVRTNENFEVTVEFPISVIVKPVAMNFQQLQQQQRDEMDDERPKTSNTTKKSKSNNKKKNFRTDRVHNLNDMADLQQTINQQEGEDELGIDDILEDESIYSLATGNLDVGELVAQTFWLNLDPYPKKPGSGPMEFTISG